MRTIITGVLVLCVSFLLNAQLLLEENFDYGAVDDTSIVKLNPDWQVHSGTDDPGYSAAGLSYPGYIGSGIGGAVAFTFGTGATGNDGDINRKFPDTLVTDATLYVSFLLELSAARTGDYFFHLGPYTLGGSYRLRLFAKDTVSGGWKMGLSKSNSTVFYNDVVLSYNQTYLVVAKYNFSTAATTDDLVEILVFSGSVPAQEAGSVPVLALGPLGAGVDDPNPRSIGTLAVRQGTNTPTGKIDGIRVATSWDYAPVPVELTSFSATLINSNDVELIWKTSTETNNSGFDLFRDNELIAFVKGSGTTSEAKTYSFKDANLSSKSYTYRLEQIDFDGTRKVISQTEVNVNSIPDQFVLEQNYPNPFNPSTTINYQLPKDGFVSLNIYDMLGNELKSLVNTNQPAGKYEVKFDASGLASGMYLYKIQINSADGGFSATKKLALMK